MNTIKPVLNAIWNQLYGENHLELLESFITEISGLKERVHFKDQEKEWYKDAIVYSLYVDLFNKDFRGLEDKLDYIAELGVNCLWLLPILDSPMKDAGFDMRDYRKIRPGLLGLDENAGKDQQHEVFRSFLEKAHERGIRIIFDIAINHTSDKHPWFLESRKSKDNPYRDFYIWNKDTDKYQDARIIFYGIEESNWKKDGEEYFFHRFFDFQPDLNYRNPEVLLDMSRNLLFWLEQGADGFRADAIPYLWKEDGTACENLLQTHTIIKFFRAVLDYVRANTLLLAEACQQPIEVVKYFGDGDECHAGYHFPLMPQMFKALAAESRDPVVHILSKDVTPDIPEGTQWFTFLRLHDELSLELVYVSEEDRKYIHDNYCKKPEWDFRLGQGISARLAELMDRDPRKIGLIFSIMLTLPGTPVIYYGDEFGRLNDENYYREQIRLTGKDDTRFLVRGRIDWKEVENQLQNPDSFEAKVYQRISKLIRMRRQYKCFGRGDIQFITVTDMEGIQLNNVLGYIRKYQNEQVLILNNLSDEDITIQIPECLATSGENNTEGKSMELKGYEYRWIPF